MGKDQEPVPMILKMFLSGISNSSFIGLLMQHRVYKIIGACILIGFICVSCASNNSVRYKIGSTKYIQSVSDIKYHDISDMSKPFRTDGYYIRKDKDTTLVDDRIIIFYNDGTFSEHIIKSPDESNEAVEINKYIMKSSILSNNSLGVLVQLGIQYKVSKNIGIGFQVNAFRMPMKRPDGIDTSKYDFYGIVRDDAQLGLRFYL